MNLTSEQKINCIKNLITNLENKRNDIDLQIEINRNYLANFIKSNCFYLRYNEELIDAYIRGNTTEENKKEAKSTYNAMCDLIISLFDKDSNYEYKNNIIEDISYYGYNHAAVKYKFTVNGLHFAILIPIIKNMSNDDIFRYSEGKLVIFYEESEYYSTSIAGGYNYEDLYKPFNKWMRENCAEEKAKISQKNKEE